MLGLHEAWATLQALAWTNARTLQQEDRTRVAKFVRDPRIQIKPRGDFTSGGFRDDPKRCEKLLVRPPTPVHSPFSVVPLSISATPPSATDRPQETRRRSQPSHGGCADVSVVSAGGVLLRQQEGPAQP